MMSTGCVEDMAEKDCGGHMESLPLDIWDHILAFLAQEQPSAWVVTASPERTPPKRIATRRPWHPNFLPEEYDSFIDCKAPQRSLLHLSLASKAIAAIVEPYLYNSIILYGGRGLASLDILLRRKPQLGQLVRKLYCLFDLKSQAAIEEWYLHDQEERHGKGTAGIILRQDLPAMSVQGASATSERRHKPTRPVATVSWAGRRDLPISLVPVFNRALQRTAVKDLYCSWVSVLSALCGAPGMVTPKLWLPRHAWGPVPRERSMCRWSADLPLKPDCHSLSSLKRLRLWRDADPSSVLWWLPWFPSLEVLELGGVLENLWWFTPPGCEEYQETFPQIKQLKLKQVSLTESDLVRLLDLFPGLQTIVLSCITRHLSYYPRRTPAPLVRTFREALLERADTMRHIEFRCDNSSHFLASRISQLRQFSRLEYLSITVGGDPGDRSETVQQWKRKSHLSSSPSHGYNGDSNHT